MLRFAPRCSGRTVLSGWVRSSSRGAVAGVATGMRGGFGRGRTTIGGIYLTRCNTSRTVLRHETVHADQWARYGVSFAVRYLFEEYRHPGAANKYEIEAGLADGGYSTGRCD